MINYILEVTHINGKKIVYENIVEVSCYNYAIRIKDRYNTIIYIDIRTTYPVSLKAVCEKQEKGSPNHD